MYNFDEIISRKSTSCVKYDKLVDYFGKEDLLPLWVADMDFRAPDFITDALKKRVEHPVFGYGTIPSDYFTTIAGWVYRLHGWKVAEEEIRYVPGIVRGIGFVVNALLEKDDKIIVQPPVYHPFRIVPQKYGHEIVYNPLLPVEDTDGRLTAYRMDFDGLERIMDGKTKLLILSNPHNPGGICWDRETLCKLAEITSRHGVTVISDEIHAEMVLNGKQHIPYASVSRMAEDNSITFMAPSKTFNIAGIVSSYAIVKNPSLREKLYSWMDAGELDRPSIFSVTATMAAYKNGWEWRKEMLEYIQDNIDFTDRYLREFIPSIHCLKPQASFLIWLDCRKLGLPQAELVKLFIDKAGLALNDGTTFSSYSGEKAGPEGEGFMRLNVGCPKAVLEKALNNLRRALE